jgi:hypothetical protein
MHPAPLHVQPPPSQLVNAHVAPAGHVVVQFPPKHATAQVPPAVHVVVQLPPRHVIWHDARPPHVVAQRPCEQLTAQLLASSHVLVQPSPMRGHSRLQLCPAAHEHFDPLHEPLGTGVPDEPDAPPSLPLLLPPGASVPSVKSYVHAGASAASATIARASGARITRSA